MQGLYLVTGAAGFVGEHLVRHLHSRGVAVRAMVRRTSQAAALEPYAEVVVADITQPDTLPQAMAGVSGIYHVAALFRQAGVPDAAFYDVNVAGVQNVFEAAITAGVPRIVHCSTNGVHSHIKDPPANESAPFNPGDLYQLSKIEGENIAMSYFGSGQIGGVVLRPTMIYGPGDTRTLKLFRMIARKNFFYVGNGLALTHWVDVRDLAEAFLLAMQADTINAEAFLIGGDRYMTLKDTVQEISRQLNVPEPSLHLPTGPVMALAHATEWICKPFGIEPPLFPRRVSFFLKNRAFDISKARTELGFAPKQDFSGEVADIIKDYFERGYLTLS
ncbi:NAD-dependent epimerase/dehydratase family protein [Salipiger aestuarii]|uniref:Nucleoside-diphosphate-sugar epimerase n=1 Tax=Salipiger aestuarii TaxID=568098 RepID=A0A327XYT2_9RHOB|nr:NAD-dependent epimerase/dehydratase family protein [Salipiger aestuarii]KAA8610056.1 oxidoreductase [Salipiger aestuarii]KAB2541224.1 oxidoreductase [Salipiger aestuarii]RAK13883.1 nucleoside-diphosphate-sugar epimerase [Salipiger aestuarii]